MFRREIFKSVVEYDYLDASNSKIIKALIGRPICLCKVSPLYRASFEDDALDELAARLEQKLVTVVNVDVEIVKIEPVEGFPFSYPAIEIQVISGNKWLYHGILFSVDEAESRPTEYTPLPFLAVIQRCHAGTCDAVHNFIRDRFVCNISPFELTEKQIQWVGAIIVNETLRRKSNAGVTFVHSISAVASEITHEVSSEYLETVWSECLLTRENVLKVEQVDQFFLGIWLHAKRLFGIDLCNYPIVRLSVKGGFLNFQKRMKIKVEHATVLYILLTFISNCIRTNYFSGKTLSRLKYGSLFTNRSLSKALVSPFCPD